MLPFFRVENPAGNCKIILTLQKVKPLKRERNFFLKLKAFTVRPLSRSTDAARQHPFYTQLYNALAAEMLCDGAGIHCQHDEASQVC